MLSNINPNIEPKINHSMIKPLKQAFNRTPNFKNSIHKMLAKSSKQSLADKLNINRSKRKKRTIVPDLDGKPLEWNLQFQNYLKDIEEVTGREIPTKQKKLIKTALTTKKYYKLSPHKSKENRSKYSRKRKHLISEWEQKTNQKWPVYDKALMSKKGKLVRMEGATYDCHHIILSSWGGDAEWWNMHPARFPDEHQQKIHSKGGLCSKIFGKGGS